MMKSEEEIRRQVVGELSFGESVSETQLFRTISREVMDQPSDNYIRLGMKKKLRKNVFNSIRRMDVLQDFLEDEDVTEIMVNGESKIFVEKNGRIYDTTQKFSYREKLDEIIQEIAAKGNRIVNESSPILDVRLMDGSRVNIVLPPVAMDGPVVTI